MNTNETETIEQRVIKVIARALGIEEAEVVPKARFVNDFNADMVAMLVVAESLEKEFGLQISKEDTEKFLTVQDAINCIKAFEAGRQRVIGVIARVLAVEEGQVVATADLIKDLRATGTDKITIVQALELEFGRQIPTNEAKNFRTVQNVIDYISKRPGGASQMPGRSG